MDDVTIFAYTHWGLISRHKNCVRTLWMARYKLQFNNGILVCKTVPILRVFQGKDEVMECVWNEETDTVEVRRSFNKESGKQNVLHDSVGFCLYIFFFSFFFFTGKLLTPSV